MKVRKYPKNAKKNILPAANWWNEGNLIRVA
jgi:hypothetical protein